MPSDLAIVMPPVRFAWKSSRKRRRWQCDGGPEGAAAVVVCSGAFQSEEDAELQVENMDSAARAKRRPVELLEDSRTKVERLKDEGNRLADAGRFRAAMSRWHEALGVDASNAVLYELLAQASMAVYEDFQAVMYARRATDLAPAWSDGFLTLARCHLNFGELTLARDALQQAVALNAGAWTDEMAADRQEIEKQLARQDRALRKRDEEAAREVELDKLQVISCFKHLTLRAKTGCSLEGRT